MINYEFNYLKDFKCIASKCKHSCCKGWEIPIDKKSLRKYKKVKGGFGARIKNGVNFKNRSFNLIDKRCPFLNKENLCDIIITLGENSLSEICSLHPRFKTFFSGRIETGLGLCCEEACRLILFCDKQTLVKINGKKEKLTAFEKEKISFREKAIKIVEESKTVDSAIESLKEFIDFNVKINYKKLYDFMFKLERLDKPWGKYLVLLKINPEKSSKTFECAYKNILTYFIYRHTSNAQDKLDLKTRTAFSILGTIVIKRICDNLYKKKKNLKKADVIEVARSFSSEIEYSDNNLAEFYSYIERLNNLKE